MEELNYLAQRLDTLSDEQFIIYQALFDQRFGDVDSDELLSVKDLKMCIRDRRWSAGTT